MSSILAIAWSTMLQMRRQRMLLVPIIAFVLSIIVLGASIVLDDSVANLAHDEAMLATWTTSIAAGVAATIYAVIIGSSLIARELSSGTMLMLGARPIPRWHIIMGRFAGAAVFLLAALLATTLAYALTGLLLSGTIDVFAATLRAFLQMAPVVLLGTTFGIAFSVQGRAVAATGSAMAVAIFALVASVYATTWQREQHLRSYLKPAVRETMPSNGTLIGPMSMLVTRALPFGTFATWVVEHPPIIDGATTEPWDESINVADQSSSSTMATTAGGPLEDAPPPNMEGATSPPLPTKQDRQDCIRWDNGASCWFGDASAWRVKSIPPQPDLHDGLGLLLAFLAIPLWLAIATVLLQRRRDLVS